MRERDTDTFKHLLRFIFKYIYIYIYIFGSLFFSTQFALASFACCALCTYTFVRGKHESRVPTDHRNASCQSSAQLSSRACLPRNNYVIARPTIIKPKNIMATVRPPPSAAKRFWHAIALDDVSLYSTTSPPQLPRRKPSPLWSHLK